MDLCGTTLALGVVHTTTHCNEHARTLRRLVFFWTEVEEGLGDPCELSRDHVSFLQSKTTSLIYPCPFEIFLASLPCFQLIGKKSDLWLEQLFPFLDLTLFVLPLAVKTLSFQFFEPYLMQQVKQTDVALVFNSLQGQRFQKHFC